MLAKQLLVLAAATGIAGSIFLAHESTAEACGCFSPPDPSVPIVQAGERIAFDIKEGIVTSHIQIAYSGPATEFGWLLPLPSIPELEVGTDELFAQLVAQTQPLYRLDASYMGNCPFDPNRNGGGFGSPSSDSSGTPPSPDEGDGGSVVVLQDSVGPYDYAVLRADTKQPMLDWLTENGYFIPAGTDDVVDAYIRPGAYFLALRLAKGNDAGDLQPVVVKYQSDLPMIPLVLTSVAADPDMAIQVWVLGDERAIPRNYYHTKINDAKIDWVNFGSNYAEVVTDAVDEAEGHHSFVTEYAGTTDIMKNVIDFPGRFGNTTELSQITDAVDFVNYLNWNNYPVQTFAPPTFQPQYTSQALSILQGYLPVPQKLLDSGVTANEYYINFSFYINTYQDTAPELFEGLDLDFDPYQLSLDLEERIVIPTQAAGKLFEENSYMTRMFTTLSPEEMTKDPVFSFNPDLVDVSNTHSGRITYYCGLIPVDGQTLTPAVIVTEDGFSLSFPQGTGTNPWDEIYMPGSRFIEVLREEGDPEILTDNTTLIHATINTGDGGCSVGGNSSPLGAGFIALFALVAFRRRRNA